METSPDQRAEADSLRVALSAQEFDRWWATALTPHDTDTFVNLYGGTELHARFVCILDMWTHGVGIPWSYDLAVRAYLLAANLPDDDETRRAPKTRMDAQTLYGDPAVQWLIDKVESRAVQKSAERITRLTTAKLEELHERAETLYGDDRLEVEDLFLDKSIKFLGIRERARSADMSRADKKAVIMALAANRRHANALAKPPSAEEFKQFLLMMQEALGPEKFQEALGSVMKPALEAHDAARSEG